MTFARPSNSAPALLNETRQVVRSNSGVPISRSSADWLDELKLFIEDPTTVVASPHEVWGPQTNDLVLQLRKRGITKVVVCGMLANICVESHLRDLLEQEFEVDVVRDATAGPRHPTRGDGYLAALVNYAYLAHAVVFTADAVAAMATERP